MAANTCPVTPERVRKILSSFLSDGTKNGNDKETESESTTTATDAKSQDKENTTTEKKQDSCPNLRSRDAFFTRVATFSPLTWFAKPGELSPLVCAQYGWENTDVDMLRCVSCKSFLCGKLPANTDQVAYKEACEKLKKSICASHEKICSWSTNPAPDWYMHVPHYDLEEVRRDFQTRYRRLKEARDTLPDINYDSLAKFGFDTYHCGRLTFSLDKSSTEGMKVAAALAVTGWAISNNDTLVCEYCQRKAGLWNFKVKISNGSDQNGDSDPPLKKQKLENKDSFDPSDEHRTFCPWIKLQEQEDNSQSATGNNTSQTSPSLFRNNSQSSASNKNSQPSPSLFRNNSQPNTKHSPVPKSPNTQSPGLNSSQCSDTSNDSFGSPGPAERKEGTKLPGWVQNLNIIAPSLLSSDRESLSKTIRKSPMVVGLRSIRRLFKDWASPETKQTS
ncbi:nuclear-interacting partner of ALK-like [Haliotis rubra]|uniref:nuclear-interacting partner of ALK-like n=1 Tax=Haliotis rubra TaxID=36100 RepID=UPI001EE5D553|nr:nuclear-interacting partner of ALK-like [Haliotis rubra]